MVRYNLILSLCLILAVGCSTSPELTVETNQTQAAQTQRFIDQLSKTVNSLQAELQLLREQLADTNNIKAAQVEDNSIAPASFETPLGDTAPPSLFSHNNETPLPNQPVSSSRPKPITDHQTRQILLGSYQAQQTKLKVLADNLSNRDTIGFKASRVLFENLKPLDVVLPGALDEGGNTTPTGTLIGQGVKVSCIQTNFSQGALRNTGKELDIAIEGDGFLQVVDPSTSEILYTRSGTLSINANNQLVLTSSSTGRLLEPAISIPTDATSILISPSGDVMIKQAGSSTLSSIGTLELAWFVNNEGLIKLGENLYAQSDASNSPILTTPGTDGLGQLRQGMLEMSNVDQVRTYVDLQETQSQLAHLRSLLGLF